MRREKNKTCGRNPRKKERDRDGRRGKGKALGQGSSKALLFAEGSKKWFSIKGQRPKRYLEVENTGAIAVHARLQAWVVRQLK